MKHLLTLALTITAGPLFAQVPALSAAPGGPAQLSGQPGPAAASVTESSRITRVIPGPDGRPQAFLLRNGSFVALTPGLTQQIPLTVRRSLPLSVSGTAIGERGEKTIQAQHITIAGVSYDDAPGRGPLGMGAPSAPPPPPQPAAGAPAPPPPGRGVSGLIPPPPVPVRGDSPLQGPAGNPVPPGSATVAPPPPTGTAPRPGLPASTPVPQDATAPVPPTPGLAPRN